MNKILVEKVNGFSIRSSVFKTSMRMDFLSALALPDSMSLSEDEAEKLFLSSSSGNFCYGINTSILDNVFASSLDRDYSISIEDELVRVKAEKHSFTIPLSLFGKEVTDKFKSKAESILHSASKGKIDREISDSIIYRIRECATKDLSKRDDILSDMSNYISSKDVVLKIFVAFFQALGILSPVEIEEKVRGALLLSLKSSVISGVDVDKTLVLENI